MRGNGGADARGFVEGLDGHQHRFRQAAGPGKRSLLSIAVQFYGRPSIVAQVPAASFYPPPEVDSAIVRIDVFGEPPVDVDDPQGFFKLVRAGFSAVRKQVLRDSACPKPKRWRCWTRPQ